MRSRTKFKNYWRLRTSIQCRKLPSPTRTVMKNSIHKGQLGNYTITPKRQPRTNRPRDWPVMQWLKVTRREPGRRKSSGKRHKRPVRRHRIHSKRINCSWITKGQKHRDRMQWSRIRRNHQNLSRLTSKCSITMLQVEIITHQLRI